MIIQIPYIEKRDIHGKPARERKEMTVEIDTSFSAHLKWEEQFQETLKCDLATYTERVRGWLKSDEQSKANFIGMLKLLYCFIESDRLPTFKSFVKLFDYEVAGEILEKIGEVLSEVGKTASKN